MGDELRVRNTVNGRVLGNVVQAGVVLLPGQRATPRQLPSPPSGFVGREGELACLGETSAVRTVIGPGGVGKTWLALRWAHENREKFPDGQIFVDLRGFSPDPPMAPDTAVRGFLVGLGVDTVPPDPHARAALYRSLTADKRMLVVLDNAFDAAQVEPLLPGGTDCVVLITSRHQLPALVARHGARPVRLSVLDDAAGTALLVERLGAARLSDPDAVREILNRCGGLPLALGVVVARARVAPELSLTRIAAELAGFDDPDPQTSLPAVLSWSMRALTIDQARALARLAAAPGPDIGADAAACLAGGHELRALERLSLLDRDSAGRYRAHDLIREHARADDPPALRRIIDHYLHAADAADQVLYPLRPQVALPQSRCPHTPTFTDVDDALSWFDAEHRCLLAAVDVAAEQGLHEVVRHLARTLTTYHHRRADAEADICTWTAVLRTELSAPDRVLAHRRLGEALARAHRHDDGIVHLLAARELAERADEIRQLASTHRALAWAYGRRGDDTAALGHAEEYLRLATDTPNRIHARNATAWFAARLGDLDRARTLCDAALALDPNPEGEASTRETLGQIEFLSGRPHDSIAQFDRALAIRRRHGYLRHTANTLDRLTHPLRQVGRHDDADRAARESAALLASLGLPRPT